MESSFIEELDNCIRARFTVICVVSLEEESILEQLRTLCTHTNRRLYRWDHADYFQVLCGDGAAPNAKDPLSALNAIEHMDNDAIVALCDFHQCWHGQPRVVRKLRNLAANLKFSRKTVIITAPTWKIPDELRDEIVVMDFPAPGLAEMELILSSLTSAAGVKINLTPVGREKLLQAALGLSCSQARRVFSRAIVAKGGLDERDIDSVNAAKKQIIRDFGALEFFSPSETISDVGGLNNLKEWLRTREKAFSKEARTYGLPEPKGIALIGIPGTGKSLTAKMIAGLWRLPLVRLDLGALFGSFVGQSEENTRRALSVAEIISPCILWIDEIEKGLSVSGGDGGTSMRVFAGILSWMQEKTKPVFVVATANNIALIPPELMRKGRVDEVFFLDLPTFQERQEIFEVHLRKRRRPVQNYDLDRLAQASQGFVGAEIEQAVIDAMYYAFSDRQEPGRDFTTDDILMALEKQVPISRSHRETIDELRKWLSEGRAQSASLPE
jgi:AAA+ superfamily predicted ATPase